MLLMPHKNYRNLDNITESRTGNSFYEIPPVKNLRLRQYVTEN